MTPYLRILLKAAVLIALLQTTGCSMAGGMKLPDNAEVLNRPGKFSDHLSADASRMQKLTAIQASRPKPEASPTPNEHSREIALISGYTLELLGELVRNSPFPRVRPVSQVSSCPVFSDEIGPDNIIHICLDTLSHLEDRSQLQFLLAHELSHVLLAHGEAAADLRNEVKNSPYVGLLSAFKFAYYNNKDAGIARSQEIEADEMGVDLLVKSGGNPDGALAVLDLIANSDLARTTYQDKANKQAKSWFYMGAHKAEKTKDFTDAWMTLPDAAIAAAAGVGVDDSQHPTPKFRAAHLAAYIKANYAAEESRSVGKLPWSSRADQKYRPISQLFAILSQSEAAFEKSYAATDKLNPLQTLNWHALGLSAATAGIDQAALHSSLETLNKLASSDDRARLRAAFLSSVAGDDKAAIAHLKILRDKNPDDFRIAVTMARELRAEGQSKEASEVLWRAVGKWSNETQKPILNEYLAAMFYILQDENRTHHFENACSDGYRTRTPQDSALRSFNKYEGMTNLESMIKDLCNARNYYQEYLYRHTASHEEADYQLFNTYGLDPFS
jgi:predicted Zn-dependent protease